MSTASPTLAQVAELAGVSPATVSRVLRGSAPVSAHARARVERAAQRLGYVRHQGRPDRTGSVAVVICDEAGRVFSDPFYARLLWGVNRALRGGPQLMVLWAGRAEDWGAVGRYLRGGGADGCLLVGARPGCPLDELPGDIPIVLAGRPAFDVRLPYVDADNLGGAKGAVEYLVDLGRQRIATIAGPQELRAGGDRLEGYRKAVGDAGLAQVVAHGDFLQASGEHAMNRLLDLHPDLDAVLAASDLMALGALRALRRAGRRVPEDVAVIGFDDGPMAKKLRLTTVRQPVEEMGARMAGDLLARVAGQAGAARSVLRTKLIVRETA
ncbi:LacI family DNA-binding transcriptional regulator [Actinocorallia longicatena]|uniref:LacI family DNA-binding transcriptional regulator n=1 Tax=Actinocorallia longicatena TaxID=111803 RepID=A0ABP6PYM8_9ACTN